jgi:hypothetical protein
MPRAGLAQHLLITQKDLLGADLSISRIKASATAPAFREAAIHGGSVDECQVKFAFHLPVS